MENKVSTFSPASTQNKRKKIKAGKLLVFATGKKHILKVMDI